MALLFAFAAFGILARLLLGGAAGILLCLLAVLFLLDATPVLGLDPFVLATLGLQSFLFLALGLLGLAPLGVTVLQILAVLLLEHVALHVGAAAPYLDIDGAGAALRARQLQLALRLALQGDLAGRAALLVTAMGLAQVRQQFELGLVTDAGVGTLDLDTGL